MNELLEAVTVAEEVTATGETVGSTVDLTTVSQQLAETNGLLVAQMCNQWLLLGALLGCVVALVFRGFWK